VRIEITPILASIDGAFALAGAAAFRASLAAPMKISANARTDIKPIKRTVRDM
jgi:hypothetical protein